MRIQPARRIRGRLRLPGDKSISHRAAMLAALADGSSRLSNFSTSQDCASTLGCLRELAVVVEQKENNLRIEGVGARALRAAVKPLDCGNSGSTMRLLAGILAGHNFVSVLTGDKSLRSRPMKRIIEPLELMGARVEADNGRPPLRINGSGALKRIQYELPVASAQVKSCILLAALTADGRTEVVEKLGATRDHTERMLRWFGVPVEIKDALLDGVPARVVGLDGPAHLGAQDVSIPGDLSSAAFFIAAAALLPRSDLEIANLGINPTRALFLSLMRQVGADLSVENRHEECNEPVGDIRVCSANERPKALQRIIIREALIPQLIDELPILAVVGTQLAGGIEIRDAAELRFKETDRIAATVNNLQAMGASVKEYEDGLVVDGPQRLEGAEITSHGDHRIAMAFTIAALVAEGESEISGVECVAVSFPEFFDLLDSVVER